MDKHKTFPLLSTQHRVRARGQAARLAILTALLGAPALSLPIAAQADVSIGITIAPPALPIYTQPPAPAPGYIWTPGYWAWGPDGYYWVDGAWLMPPSVGMLWTPGWWGWSDGYYRWHGGYWGPQVGFYGGIDYGFGYFGIGYVGGGWRGNHFYYNRAVTNVNITHVRNVYVDKTVIHDNQHNRVSYNGGRGGLRAAPSPEQRHYAQQRHQTLPSMAGRHDNAAPSRPQRPDRPPAGRQSGEQRARFDAPPGQRPADRPQTMPGRAAPSGSAHHGPTPNDIRGSRNEPGRPSEGPRSAPQFNRAPERPRTEVRPAAAPERPRQDVRAQEFRPPRAQAPARQERQGTERPERRGEGHSRQGRDGR